MNYARNICRVHLIKKKYLLMDGSEKNYRWRSIYNLWIFVCLCATVLVLLDYYPPNGNYRGVRLLYSQEYSYSMKQDQSSMGEFLIHTPGCRIPKLNPFDPSVEQFIFKEKPFQCNNNLPPLVKDTLTTLTVLNSSFKAYGIEDYNFFECCYVTFKRSDPIKNEQDDDIISEDICYKFRSTIKVKTEFVKVKCFYNRTEIYKDFFSFVPPKFKYGSSNSSMLLNVLIAGLDGVSRVNVHRQMPLTIQVIKNELKAVELLGYNKVGENTFPNLIPILTGQSEDELVQKCWPSRTIHFDDCLFIWKQYKEKNYVTSYAEDASWMGIFNYQKKGFRKQPTDYYWRTFSYTADKEVGNQFSLNNNLCIGARPEYNILLNYTKKFVKSMSIYNKPFFSFFWSASLSHNYLNYPHLGDKEFAFFFRYLQTSGVLNQTVLIFLSDHGIRWSEIRFTTQGTLEAKLPFVFIVLPEWYKRKYKQLYSNLRSNSKRLTTPFDLHETLIDLLKPFELSSYFLNERSQRREPSRYSLFDSIPKTRTCDLAMISSHWCACQESVEINSNSTMAVEAADFTIKYLNDKISHFKKCQNLTLKEIISARVSYTGNLNNSVVGTKKDYIVSFVAVPGNAIFEVTVRQTFLKINTTNSPPYTLKITGTVSRLNLYGEQSSCVSDFHIKLYCYCDNT